MATSGGGTGFSAASPGIMRVEDGAGTTLATVGTTAFDGLATSNGFLTTMAAGFVYNGSTWDRVRSASAAALASQGGTGAGLVAPPGMWTVEVAPGANIQATATKAAGGAGARHVCWGVVLTFSAGAVAPAASQQVAYLRDGATGAGTPLLAVYMSLEAVAGDRCPPILLTGLSIVGSAATAMTLEFGTAGGANTAEAVTLIGYDVG